MSGDHRDEYRSPRSANPDDRNLPPIREVFGDELDRPARPNPYSFGDVQRALPLPGSPSPQASWSGHHGYSARAEHRGPATLPPIQQYHGHSSRVVGGRETPVSHRQSSEPRPRTTQHSSRSGHDRTYEAQDPGYSYGVLRTSGTSGALTDATPPSSRPQGILRQTAAPVQEDPDDINKRYKCDYCGKRFGMPSHLQIHVRTHTAQRPFACEWPGCDRTFSVRSNMMRHYRSHDKYTGSRQSSTEFSKDDDDDYDTGGEREESASSQYFHRSSSFSHGSSSQYYSSSRRK